MKKILLLCMVILLLCWGISFAAKTVAADKTDTSAKVEKTTLNGESKDDPNIQNRPEMPELPAAVSRAVIKNDQAAEELQKKQNIQLEEAKLEEQAKADRLRDDQAPTNEIPHIETFVPLHDPNPPVTLDLILSQSFDADTLLPTDWIISPLTYRWRFGNGSASGGPGAGNVHSTPNAAFFHVFSYPSGQIDSLISPSMDLSAHSGSYVLRFWNWEPIYSGYDDSATVWLYENGNMTWLYHIPYASAWTINEIPFSSSSNDARIYFIGYSDYGYKDPYIDDITVRDAGDVIIGRCCYGDPAYPSCTDVSHDDCIGLGGTWDESKKLPRQPMPLNSWKRLQYSSYCQSRQWPGLHRPKHNLWKIKRL